MRTAFLYFTAPAACLGKTVNQVRQNHHVLSLKMVSSSLVLFPNFPLFSFTNATSTFIFSKPWKQKYLLQPKNGFLKRPWRIILMFQYWILLTNSSNQLTRGILRRGVYFIQLGLFDLMEIKVFCLEVINRQSPVKHQPVKPQSR